MINKSSQPPSPPKFYRPIHRKYGGTNKTSWEIYSWKCWFITISAGTLEIHINKWK